MSPDRIAAAIVAGAGLVGFGVALLFGFMKRARGGSVAPRVVLARGASYLALALVLAVSILAGTPGIAILLGGIGAVALVEWVHLTDLPRRHLVALEACNVAIFIAIAVRGSAAVDLLVGGLVLAGIALPVLRPDTTRAIRDFGVAAVGLIIISVMLAHGVALAVEFGALGAALVGTVAVACAGSDVGAFVIGRRFGRSLLAPRLSPAKTRAGLVGNLLGAALGIALFLPAIGSSLTPAALALLVPVIAIGSVWGDLFESAAKREFGVKDAGSWLPGFGGILDRVDSLLVALPLTYWLIRLMPAAA